MAAICIPEKKMLSRLLPDYWADLYFKSYSAIKGLKSADVPQLENLHLLVDEIHQKFCSAVEFLDELDILVGSNLFAYYLFLYYGEDFNLYRSMMQIEFFFPDPRQSLDNRTPYDVAKDLPAINACLAVFCLWQVMIGLSTLARKHPDTIGFAAGVNMIMMLGFTAVQGLRLPEMKVAAGKDNSGEENRRSGLSWVADLRRIDEAARKILTPPEHRAAYEFHKDAFKGSLLNNSALAVAIERRFANEEQQAKAAGRLPVDGREQNAEDEASRKQKTLKLGARQIQKYLKNDLYGSDLTIADVLDHPFQWHLLRDKVPRKKAKSARKRGATAEHS